MKLKRTLWVLLALVLTFAALFAVTMFGTSAADGDVVTPYGTVPASKISEHTYVALFAQTGVDANGNPTYKFLETGTGDESTKNNVFIEKGVDRARQFLNVGTGTYRAEVSYGNVVVYMLKDCLSSRGKGWQSANNIDGKVTIDLGGHTLTATDPRLIGFEALTSTAAGKDVATTIEFKNGTLKTSKPLHEVYGNSGIYEGTKVANVIYDGVTFVPNGTLTSFTMINAKGGYNTTQMVDFEVEFNNCTFNYDKATALTIINDTAADGSVTCTAKINRNCTINMDAMPTVSGTSSEDRFGWGAGEYGTIPFDKLTSSTVFATFAKNPGDTKYTFISTYGSFIDGALNNTKDLLKQDSSAKVKYLGGTAAILMLVDEHTTSGASNGGAWNNAATIDGTIIIDLNGKILNSSAPRLVGFLTTANVKDSTIAIKNGTLRTSKVIAEVWTEGTLFEGTKNCNLVLDNLIIMRSGSPSSYTMLKTKTNSEAGYSDTMKANFNVTINNCKIDYSTASDFKLIDDAITKGSVACNVTVTGGNISGKTSVVTANGFSDDDSFIFLTDKKGAKTTFVFDYSADNSSAVFMTDEGEMHLASTNVANRTSYALSNVYIDGYGYLPASEVGKTFSVFDAERKLHLGSYNSYASGALERVRNMTNAYSSSCEGLYKEGTVTMILHKDYTHNDSWYGNYAHLAGTFVLDLNGHTIIQGSNGLFNFIAKKSTFGTNPSVLNTTTTIVKNGTILTRMQPVVKINNNRGSGNFDYEGTKVFNIEFDNVTFDKYWVKNDTVTTYNSIIWSEINGTLGVDVNATFNDCNFTSCDSIMFDVGLSNSADVDVTINGGVINTSNMSNLTILKSSDANDTLTFGKGYDERYTSLVLPASAPAPTESYNNGTLAFAQIESGAETTTYRLQDKSVMGISYTPKMSITLDRTIHLNIYLPTEALVNFEFDGTSYENLSELPTKTVGGKTYYVITSALPSSEAMRDLNLTVTIDIGEQNATGKFSFSVSKYAKKVLGAGTLVEKQIVRDTLSYIRAAYVYFNPTDTAAISKIDTIIGKNYDVTSPVTVEGSTTPDTDGFISATLNLSENPGIRFYVAADANAEDYSFYRIENGEEVAIVTEIGTDDNGKYLELDVYAYAMCDTVYYRTTSGASGNYHIASYYAFANTQSDAALLSLVERFWKYAQSARDYKNAVTVTVNFVDESGKALADSQTVVKAPGAEVSFISPAVDGYYTRDLYVYSSATENEVINVVYKLIPTNVDKAVANTLISNVTAWGDSITQGSNAGNLAAANDHGIDLVALGSTATGGNYCNILKNLIRSKVYSSTVVYNLGVGSETTATIACRANTESYYFYIDTAATLTDAPIVIDLKQNKDLNLDGLREGVLRRDDISGGFISTVYMTGKDESGKTVTVKGTLTCTLTSDAPAGTQLYNCDYKYLKYTFTRNDGKTDKVIFDQYTRVVTEASVALDGNTCIIFMGENGGYNKDNATIIAQQEEILEACGNPEYFLIISSTSKTTADRKSLNDALSARWGDNYINMGNVLNSSRASYEFAGYSEEAIVAVLDNIIEGSVTDLLLADGCHPNAVGYTVIANAMFERLYQLGAFDAIFDYYDSLNAAK